MPAIWEQNDPVVSPVTTPELASWERDDPVEKPIGLIEAAIEAPLEKIPFSPAAAAKAVNLLQTANRLQSMDYKRFVDEERLGPYGGAFMDPPRIGQRTPEEYHADDVKRMTAYFDDLAEKERRGYSLWGRVGQITSYMPAFMMEFISTGGIYKLGSTTARTMAGKILKRSVERGVGKAVTGVAGVSVGAAARAAAMPHRGVEAILKRQLPKGVKIDEEGTMDIVGPKESKWTSLWKGTLDHYIEILSEQLGEFMGPAITKIARRLPLAGRLMGALQRSWLKLNPNKAAVDFGKKMLEKGGFHGVLAEIGEEDIGWISRAIFNIEDFGAGSDADLGERLRAGLEQDIANLPAEAIAFSIPGGAKAGLGMLARITEGAVPQQLTAIDETGKFIEETPNLTPEQKEIGLRYIGDIETNIVNEIIERFPDKIDNQESLERIGNQITEHLDVPKITWKWNTVHRGRRRLAFYRPSKQSITFYGLHPNLKAKFASFKFKRGRTEAFKTIENKTPGGFNQDYIKQVIIHEIGHYVKPGVGRQYHTSEFYSWVEENIKELHEEISKMKPVWHPEAIGPIGEAPRGPTPVVEEAPVAPVIEKEALVNIQEKLDKAYRENDVKEFDRILEKELAPLPPEREKNILQGHAEMLQMHMKERQAPSIPEVAEKPKRITKKKAYAMGHQIPETLGWDEGQRRDFMEQTIGVRTMKDISLEDARIFALALDKKLEEAGLKPEQLVAKFDTAVDTVNQLPKIKKERKIYTRRTAEKSIFESLKDVVAGVDNDSVSALAKIISGGKDSIITEIFDKGKNRAVTEIDRNLKTSHDTLITELDGAGITAKDLAEMSAGMDPRFEAIKFARGVAGKAKTKFHKITINNKTYKLSDANLIHVYLMAQQEDGMRHLKHKQGGLIIFNQKTGPLSDKQIGNLISRVLDNPKLKAVADIMTDISVNQNAPAINVVSNRMGEGDLANERNYSHLEVDTPRKMRGKYLQQISLLENKGLFIKRRKTGVGALVVRDAFDVFVATQEAVAEYVGMAEQLREMNSLLNYQPFIDALEEQGYGKFRNNMITILQRAQSNPQVSGSISRLLSRILRGAYRAVLILNPKIAPSQYTSTIHYLGVLDRKYWKHIGHLSKPSDVKEMLDNSPTAWRRLYIGAQSIEMARLGQLDKSMRFFTGKVADINKAGIAIKTTDILAFTDGWKAAKAIVKDTTDLKPGTKEYFAAVDKIAVDLWQETQPSWDRWNRSINTSDPTPFRQTYLLFRSYYEKALSMLHVANATYVNSERTVDDKAKLAQVYGAVLSSQMINAVLRSMVGWGLWRERKTIWDLLADMAAAPFAMFAIVGKGLQISIGNFIKTLGEKRSAYIKEPISSLPISIINIMLQAPDEFGKAAAFFINGDTKEGKKHLIKAMKHMYRSFGLISGVPVYELEKAERGWFEKKKKGTYRRTR